MIAAKNGHAKVKSITPVYFPPQIQSICSPCLCAGSQLVSALALAGADVSETDYKERTALMIAAENGHHKVRGTTMGRRHIHIAHSCSFAIVVVCSKVLKYF